VDEACAVFQRTARMEFIEPLELALDGFGTFKAKGKGGGRGGKKAAGGAHTGWVGVTALPALSTLAAAFAEAYRAEGFSIEPRAFRPHVTLARGVRASRPIELSLSPLITTASHVSLMKSDLSGARPVYTSLLAVPSQQQG
jgi:2'-5' RNA ligase